MEVPTRNPTFRLNGNAPPALKPPTRAGSYDANWRKLRNRRLDAEPLCRHCTANGHVTPAVEVDHIIPKALGGKDVWDNTQSLCVPCHRTKTREDVQRIRRGW
ncbi:HNH endonuclease [Microvirga sp. SRT01]|uniref:HNH endonuclease n=1 Tax=Sphingomonas longa TaxID=2778730 RepID=A0ABS2D859_9SPHN|nr:HNH endonuclease signature motif containing protein [Sphingomonas sp. BT552]MBM6577133.1 HNH endonuclease [Sphingomonas sp. BT552]MBR7710177.1 HNH endonuclease [Microvirga sp. SRT01]